MGKGGRSKAKAKQKTKNSKDVQQTLALSRDTTHGGYEAGGVVGTIGPDGTIIQLPRHLVTQRLSARQRMSMRHSFSPFHTRNASMRAKILGAKPKK